jgi:choline-glycine betaine transporter
MKKVFVGVITSSYLFAALALFGMAVTIMGWSVYEVIAHLDKPELIKGEFISVMLQSVGAIVISVAIIDVAKYMIEEEVFRDKELRSLKEARETMTKIIVILSIAVGIEGLVYIFKAGITDITLLLYPAALVLTSVALVIGLGLFHKLSSDSEKPQ